MASLEFSNSPRGFWKKKENQKKFFDWLGKELGYKTLDDWYNITISIIDKHGGGSMLDTFYNGSPSKALKAVYPEHKWMPWRFKKSPKGFWKHFLSEIEQGKNHKEILKSGELELLMKWMEEKLQIKHLDDWYRVSLHQIDKLCSIQINSKTLTSLLVAAYPEHKWNVEILSAGATPTKPSQRLVLLAMQELFPSNSMRFSFFFLFDNLLNLFSFKKIFMKIIKTLIFNMHQEET